MKQSNANRKTNEQAREILANILLFEVSDPRLRLDGEWGIRGAQGSIALSAQRSMSYRDAFDAVPAWTLAHAACARADAVGFTGSP